MTADRWQRIQELFSEVLDRPETEREGYLAVACAGDATLQEELRQLVQEHTDGTGFLDIPVCSPASLLKLAETSTTFNVGDIVGNRFEIRRFLARGGMGEVYEAFDSRLGEPVALKTVRRDIAADERIVRLFEEEVKAARQVASPYVCRVHDLASHVLPHGEEVTFLTMELLDGETLATRLSRETKLSPEVAIPILEQIAEGLAAIHWQGLIHRDLKCGNVFLVKDDSGGTRAVITDFGLAHTMTQGEADTVGLSLSAPAGTPAYMSPEQRAGHTLTQQSDVYSLAVVAWEMVSGSVPFPRGQRTREALQAMRDSHPAVPGRWRKVCDQALRVDPEKRFRDGLSMVRALNPPVYTRPSTLAAAILLVLATGWFVAARSFRPDPHTLAVLPLESLGGATEQEYFLDGVREQLITSLSRVPGLRVLAREGSSENKVPTGPKTEIGRRLGVAAILSGQMRHAGGRIVLDLQLVDTVRGYLLWSKHWERRDQELPMLEAEVASSVASAFQLPATSLTAVPTTYQPTGPAREQYFLGRFHLAKRTDTDLLRARKYFESALAIQPDYPVALIGLADTFTVMAERRELPPAEALGQAKEAALHALRLEPTLADAHASLGMITSVYDRDFSNSEIYFQRAISLDPNLVSAEQWYAYLLLKQRRFDEAEKHARRAVELDPVSLPTNNTLLAVLHYRGDLARAIEQAKKVIEMDPNHNFAPLFLAQDYALSGRAADARRELANFKVLEPNHPLRLRLTLEAQALLGETQDAEEKQKLLVKRYYDGAAPASYVALGFAALHHTDEALDWSERALQERDGMISLVHAYPTFAYLRQNEHYQDLLRRLGITGNTTRDSSPSR